MAVEGYFFNAVKSGDTYDRMYTAEDITNYLNLLVGDGVFPIPSTNLQVYANDGMSVIVKVGAGWIKGHKIVNTSDLVLSITESDIVLNRIDAVVFYLDKNNREMGIKIKTGAKAINPVQPELTRNENIYEMCIATVTISKQTQTLSQSTIRDTRGDSSICGWVQGLIQQTETHTLFEQWNTAYDAAIKNDTQAFNEWFDNIKQNFKTAIPIKQYTSTYITEQEQQSLVEIGIGQYNNALDILSVYVSGIRLIENVDYTINGKESITVTVPLDKDATVFFEVIKSASESKEVTA